MKERVAFLIMFCVLFTLGALEPILKIEGYPEEKLVGAVKEIKEFTGTSLSSLQVNRLIVLNEEGRISSVEQFTTNGLVDVKNIYFYNENNQLTEIVGTRIDEPGQWRYEYRYNEQGQLQEELSWSCDKTLEWRNKYNYGRLGRLVEKIAYQGDDSETMRERYRYDQEGRLAQWLILFPDGKLLKQVDFIYNDLGLVAEEVYHNENSVYKRKKFFYNKNSLWERVQTVDREGKSIETTLYFYNAAGQLVEELTRESSGALKSRRTMSYDHMGNEFARIDSQGNYLVKEISY